MSGEIKMDAVGVLSKCFGRFYSLDSSECQTCQEAQNCSITTVRVKRNAAKTVVMTPASAAKTLRLKPTYKRQVTADELSDIEGVAVEDRKTTLILRGKVRGRVIIVCKALQKKYVITAVKNVGPREVIKTLGFPVSESKAQVSCRVPHVALRGFLEKFFGATLTQRERELLGGAAM